MNSEKQYIFVNIRTPLEVKIDGTYHVLAERVIINIEPCNELPPINTSENDKQLLLQIHSIIQSSTRPEENISSSNIIASKEEPPVHTEEKEKPIQNNMNFVFNPADTSLCGTKSRQNITFRNKINVSGKSESRHYTRKNYKREEESDEDSDNES